MPIRSQVQATSETILEFEAAAEEKYEDGFSLMASASPGNGVYLMGYVAEMLLKAAYFRFQGVSDTDTLTLQRLKKARQDAKSLYGVTTNDDHFHGVDFWGELLIQARRYKGLPLGSSVDKNLIVVPKVWPRTGS